MTTGPEDPGQHGPHHTEILPASYDSPRRRPHLTGLLAVAVIALAAGGGIAYYATHSGNNVNTVASRGSAQAAAPNPSQSAPSGRKHGLDGFGRFGGLGRFGLGGFGGAIHGQITVPKAGGGYQTLAVQSGAVSAVSSSSITVKSADGYSKTYVVASSTEVNAQAAGISTVKTGDTVVLTAVVSGSEATAASIFDLTSIRSSHEHFGFPDGKHDPGQN